MNQAFSDDPLLMRLLLQPRFDELDTAEHEKERLLSDMAVHSRSWQFKKAQPAKTEENHASEADLVNNVNVSAVMKLVKALQDPSAGRSRVSISASVSTSEGLARVKLGAEEIVTAWPRVFGGRGKFLSPQDVCLAGLTGCLTSTFVTRLSMNNVRLADDIKIQAYFDFNFEGMFKEAVAPVEGGGVVLLLSALPHTDPAALKEASEWAGQHCPAANILKSIFDINWEIKQVHSDDAEEPNCGFNIAALKAAQEIFSGANGVHRRTVNSEWKQIGPVQVISNFPDVLAGPSNVRVTSAPPMGGTGAAPNPVQTCFSGIASGLAFAVCQELAVRGLTCSRVDTVYEADQSIRPVFGLSEDDVFANLKLGITIHSRQALDDATLQSVLHSVKLNNPTTWALQAKLPLAHDLYVQLK